MTEVIFGKEYQFDYEPLGYYFGFDEWDTKELAWEHKKHDKKLIKKEAPFRMNYKEARTGFYYYITPHSGVSLQTVLEWALKNKDYFLIELFEIQCNEDFLIGSDK